MSKSNIKIRAAHRVIVDGKTYEQDDFLPDDIDAGTLEQLKLSHSVYEYEVNRSGSAPQSTAEAEPEDEEDIEATANKRGRPRKK